MNILPRYWLGINCQVLKIRAQSLASVQAGKDKTLSWIGKCKVDVIINYQRVRSGFPYLYNDLWKLLLLIWMIEVPLDLDQIVNPCPRLLPCPPREHQQRKKFISCHKLQKWRRGKVGGYDDDHCCTVIVIKQDGNERERVLVQYGQKMWGLEPGNIGNNHSTDMVELGC